jgi:hypothetical protein
MVLTMTDPDETANLVAEITGAWREHQAAAAADRPQTYQEAMALQLPEQIERHRELTGCDMTARSIASLQARGEYDEERARILPLGRYQPLTAAEHVELLALGEAIASYYRHPSGVDRAARAGATWEQIAAARNTTADCARSAYREWAEGQHQYAGMGDDEYAAALQRAGGQ